MAQGYLQVDVVSDANSFPVQDADIVVARTEEPDEIIEETRTNSSGQTENLPLDAPPLELSLSPEETERPYAEYTIRNPQRRDLNHLLFSQERRFWRT